MSWMLIGSFDYLADCAARATIGENWYSDNVSTIYGNWVPNSFGNDVRLANDEEKQTIYKIMLQHYKTQYCFNKGTVNERNVGYEIMHAELKEHPLVLNLLDTMWNNKKDNNEN